MRRSSFAQRLISTLFALLCLPTVGSTFLGKGGSDLHALMTTIVGDVAIRVHEAAPDNIPVTDQTELTTEQREQLRTFTRAGFCSKSAGTMLYELCLTIVGDSGKRPKVLMNDNAALRAKRGMVIRREDRIKARIEQVEQAIQGTAGKRRGEMPMRYKGGLLEKNKEQSGQ